MYKLKRKIIIALVICLISALPITEICSGGLIRTVFKDVVSDVIGALTTKTTETSAKTDTAFLDGLTEATVTYVVDGDTFYADVAGTRTKIRLIGVDTPESVATEEYLAKSGKQNTAEGKSASDYSKQLLPAGTKVWLETDACETDDYGRLLCYVWLDSDTMVQDLLLLDGYAQTMTVPPNVKYSKRFLDEQKAARESNEGFWNGFFDS